MDELLARWSFTGLSGSQVAALAGGSAALAVLFFLLRRRPTKVTVSSHLLWQQVLPRRRNPLVKELVLLAMQVVFLAALALSLGDPEQRDDAPEPGSEQVTGGPSERVWIVDRSLSMIAQGAAGRRIDVVQRRLREELAALPDTARVSVVGAGDPAELLAPIAAGRARVDLALRLLDAGYGGADLPGALDLAASQPGLRVDDAVFELFTDDPAADVLAVRFAETWGRPLRVRAPFEPLPNVSIVAFELRGTEGLPAEQEAVVRLHNPSPWAAEVVLRLETDEVVLGRASFRLGPGEESTRRYRFSALDAEVIEAVIRQARFPEAPGSTPEQPARDALDADDHAWSWVQPVRPVSVLLVGPGNRFLERVLALLPGAHTERVTPAGWPAVASRVAQFDVVFFDGWAPPEPPPRAFFVNPPAGSTPFVVEATRLNPAVTDWNREHPLFRGLVLRDLQIERGSVLREEPGDVRLLGSPSGPLALARVDGDRRWIGWGFDFARSDLPLRLAFPQTIVNTLLWMRQGRAVGAPRGRQVTLDRPLWIGAEAPPDARPGEVGGPAAVNVVDPRLVAQARRTGDERAERRARRRVFVGDGQRPLQLRDPGLRRIEGPGWQLDVAVNLPPTGEALLAALPTDDEVVVPPPAPAGEPDPEPRPPWQWLALGVALLAFLEFGLYTR